MSTEAKWLLNDDWQPYHVTIPMGREAAGMFLLGLWRAIGSEFRFATSVDALRERTDRQLNLRTRWAGGEVYVYRYGERLALDTQPLHPDVLVYLKQHGYEPQPAPRKDFDTILREWHALGVEVNPNLYADCEEGCDAEACAKAAETFEGIARGYAAGNPDAAAVAKLAAAQFRELIGRTED